MSLEALEAGVTFELVRFPSRSGPVVLGRDGALVSALARGGGLEPHEGVFGRPILKHGVASQE